MKALWRIILVVVLQVVLPLPHAHAGSLSCSITSVSGINLSYLPSATAPLVGSGTLGISCSKSGTNLDTRYLELAADQGLNGAGGVNRAANGAARLNYSLWRDSAASGAWGSTAGTRITSTLNSTTATTLTLNWWMTVPAQQVASAGTYVDTVTLRLFQDASPNPALTDPNPVVATLSVALTVATQCTLSSPPGTVQFNYTSFQPGAATAGTSFAVTCTRGAPYSLSLDATGGTLLGLNYQLQLSASGVQTGSGLPQAVAINGTMAAGQSGICAAGSCSDSHTRVLTIAY